MAKGTRRRRNVSIRVICGQKIRTLREAQGMTRSRLASEAGVALTSLNLIEAGRIYPTLRTLEAVARTLRCRVADLVDEEPGPPAPSAGTKALFRIVQRLRTKDDNYVRAVERLITSFDTALESAK